MTINKVSPLEVLPNEIWKETESFLNGREAMNFSSVNKKLREMLWPTIPKKIFLEKQNILDGYWSKLVNHQELLILDHEKREQLLAKVKQHKEGSPERVQHMRDAIVSCLSKEDWSLSIMQCSMYDDPRFLRQIVKACDTDKKISIQANARQDSRLRLAQLDLVKTGELLPKEIQLFIKLAKKDTLEFLSSAIATLWESKSLEFVIFDLNVNNDILELIGKEIIKDGGPKRIGIFTDLSLPPQAQELVTYHAGSKFSVQGLGGMLELTRK